MRAPAAGRALSAAEDRIVMYEVPLFAGSEKFPMKVAPACTRIVSPGLAALIAACRSPPAFTVSVADSACAAASRPHISTRAHNTRVSLIDTAPELKREVAETNQGARNAPFFWRRIRARNADGLERLTI